MQDGTKRYLAVLYLLFVGAAIGCAVTWFLNVRLLALAVAQRDTARFETQRARTDLAHERAQALSNAQEFAGTMLAQVNQAVAQRDRCEARFARATLLIERSAAGPGLSLFNGAIALTPGAGGTLNGIRWFIPAEVKPLIYGDTRGAVYYYLGADSKLEGPFLPATPKPERPQ